MNEHIRVLIGSPVRQKTEILRHFLSSIKGLAMGNSIQSDYFFIDDNIEDEASQLLLNFTEKKPNTLLVKAHDDKPYVCNENTHVWDEELIWKVAGFKNNIIDAAIKGNYDYLFLVDSDLVLHPDTLQHLVSLNKDIVAEIFWTRWEPDMPELPQVWVADQYTIFHSLRGENLSAIEILQRVQMFLKQLKTPGVYQVGGLGACTLISQKAIKSGVNFSEIYNISFLGEDRHFCIRAVALGFDLFVDTHYPAFHIYRETELEGLKEFKKAD